MRPSSGAGHLLAKPFGNATTRARVGFLAENVALYHRSAASLLRFYGTLNRMREPWLRQRCHEVLRQVELEAESGRNVGKFSRGMQQRIGLAQALINDPDLLILDEPTSALDPLARVSMRELLLGANRAGKTIFLSSHLLSEIELICHRVGILNKGKLVKVGRTAELLVSREHSEVTARGIPPDSFEHSQLRGGWAVGIHRAGGVATREALERVWAQGGEVLSVNPVRRTLEEVFLSS